MDGAAPDLAGYYPSLTENPQPPDGAGPAFRAFVLANEEEIVRLGSTRFTQTNESRRCVALLPLVMMATFDRIHLIDIGTSAGLNLGLDLYHYRFDDLEWGSESPLVLTAESRGTAPRLHEIEVLSRTGLDLNPLDPGDDEARRWLDALTSPSASDAMKPSAGYSTIQEESKERTFRLFLDLVAQKYHAVFERGGLDQLQVLTILENARSLAA